MRRRGLSVAHSITELADNMAGHDLEAARMLAVCVWLRGATAHGQQQRPWRQR